MGTSKDPDPGPLPQELIDRLAEALSGESGADDASAADAASEAGLEPDEFEELAGIAEMLEYRGVRRAAEPLPEPDWIDSLDVHPHHGPAGDSDDSPSSGAAAPEARSGGSRRASTAEPAPKPMLHWVALAASMAAGILLLVRFSTGWGGGPGDGAGFGGDPDAVLNGDGSGRAEGEGELLASRQMLVLPLELDAGDTVAVTIREADENQPWTPISLNGDSSRLTVPPESWATLDPSRDYVGEVSVERLTTGTLESFEVPLRWRP